MTITGETVVAGCSEVCWGSVGSDTVVFSTIDRRMHILNSAAAHVWTEVDGEQTVSDVVDRLAARFAVPPTDLSVEVCEALEQLCLVDLCDVVSVGPGTLDPDRTDGRVGRVVDRVFVRDAGEERALDLRNSTRLKITSLGIPLCIEIGDDRFTADLRRILSPLLDDHRSGCDHPQPADTERLSISLRAVDGHWCISRNGHPVTHARSEDQALRAVLAECNAAPLPLIKDAVVLHAAGADLGGGVVLFPGVSNAGKSTLVAQLVGRGHGYLTDEAAAIDVSTLHARPFRKSICLEPGAQALLSTLAPTPGMSATWDVDPRSIGDGRSSNGGEILAIVFPTFDPSLLGGTTALGQSPRLEKLDALEALRALLANSFDFSHVGQPAFAALVALATTVPCFTMVHAGGGAEIDCLETVFSR